MSDIQEAVSKGKEFLEQKKQRASRPWSDEAKARQALRSRDYYQRHPEKRAELSEKIRSGWTKEKRKEFSRTMKRVLAQKEVRRKISAGLKRHWNEYHRWRREKGEDE